MIHIKKTEVNGVAPEGYVSEDFEEKADNRILNGSKRYVVAAENVPNATTRKAMAEVSQNKTKGFDNVENLLYDLKH